MSLYPDRSEPNRNPPGMSNALSVSMLIDGADRIGIHVGPHRLDHLETRDQVGRHRIHRHPARAELRRRTDHLAVERDVVQAGVDAAHDDEAAFTLIDFHRHAGMRRSASAALASGNRPTESADTTSMMVGGGTLLVAGQRRARGHRDGFCQAGQLQFEIHACRFAGNRDDVTAAPGARSLPW